MKNPYLVIKFIFNFLYISLYPYTAALSNESSKVNVSSIEYIKVLKKITKLKYVSNKIIFLNLGLNSESLVNGEI